MRRWCLKGCFNCVGVKFLWIIRSWGSVRFVLPLLLSADAFASICFTNLFIMGKSQHALVIKAKRVHNCGKTDYSFCMVVLQINCKLLVAGFGSNAPTTSFKGVNENYLASLYFQSVCSDGKSRDEMLTPLKLKKEFMGCPFHSPFGYWGTL